MQRLISSFDKHDQMRQTSVLKKMDLIPRHVCDWLRAAGAGTLQANKGHK